MKTRELIENSLLDAMGLLDEDETQSFERAFQAASPAVQAHVRREQTRLSHIEQLLPQVEPPADLRAAVIEAVRVEMELAAEQAAQDVRSPIFTLLPSHRVSALWRAAAIGFMTAAVVFGTTTLSMKGDFDQIEARMNANQFVEDWIMTDRDLADKYLFSDNTRLASFNQAAVPAQQSTAVLMLQTESDRAAFYCSSLPAELMGVTCELVEIDAEGNATQLMTFEYIGDVILKEVSVELVAENSFTIRQLTTDPSEDDMQFSTQSLGELDTKSLL
jgi:hypothetical protein